MMESANDLIMQQGGVNDLDRAKRVITKLQVEIERLREEVETLQISRDNARNQANDALEGMREQLAAKDAELARLRMERDEATIGRQIHAVANEGHIKDVDELKAEIERLRAELESLQLRKRSDEDQLIAILRHIGKEVMDVRDGNEKSVAGLVRQEFADRHRSWQDAHEIQELRYREQVEQLKNRLQKIVNRCGDFI